MHLEVPTIAHMNAGKPSGLVRIVHQELERIIRPGDLCIDATVGNGYDTLALAKLAGKDGVVFGFDIQEVALERTRKLLEHHQCIPSTQLFHACHSNLAEQIPSKFKKQIRVTLFNLGYLPKSDRQIVTQKESTVQAIKEAYCWIQEGGLLSVLVYRGHPGGTEEARAIEALIEEKDWKNQKFVGKDSSTSPILNLIEKA